MMKIEARTLDRIRPYENNPRLAYAVPMHVLKTFAGHADISTTATFYLGVEDSMAERARKAVAG